MPMLPLDRRTKEAIALALLSIMAVAVLRFPVESKAMFLAEMLVLLGGTGFQPVVAVFTGWKPMPRMHAGWVIIVPILFAVIARAIGSPIAFEMSALTTFGAASLALSTGTDRSRKMSMVASGFLTLFAVVISDSPYAVWIAIAWMSICVWHLVANHWERIELCRVENVRRRAGIRPLTVLAAVAICIVAGWSVRDRFGQSDRFTFGLMPVSGGTQWSDPAALSGVGTGDAAIAAKDHAESFGAVDSELFLESTESTLFDMFSDTIGEPKKKPKWERRQGMAAKEVLESHAKSAKSEKGGSSFSTDRMPAKKHLHLDDATERAVVQWAGPSGIRLAMNRYDTFDGVDWTNEAEYRNEQLTRKEISGSAWFCDPSVRGSLTRSTTSVGSLKVLRLDSTRLPVPMMTSALHIKDVDRQDFFAIEDDGSFFMPGRERVPQLTVVNVASTKVMEDELWHRLPASVETYSGTNDHRLEAYTSRCTAELQHPYAKLQAIISHLREDFTFDRCAVADLVNDPAVIEPSGIDSSVKDSDVERSLTRTTTPVSEFLRTRRGGDHLFATTAALMARQVGLQSRLVTGFYVRTSAIDMAAGHTNVLPEDVHVWAEIRLDDGCWFAIEPTPGYQPPTYTPSAWLVAKQFAAASWLYGLGLLAIAVLLFATRLLWVELGLSLLYPIGAWVLPRQRMSLAMRVIQTRAKYAGCPRVAGRPQRDWLLAITSTHDQLRESVCQFCDAADRAAFAGDEQKFNEHTASKELMMKLKIRVLRQLATEATV